MKESLYEYLQGVLDEFLFEWKHAEISNGIPGEAIYGVVSELEKDKISAKISGGASKETHEAILEEIHVIHSEGMPFLKFLEEF